MAQGSTEEHLQLGLTGHAKLGQTLDDTLGEVENGTAPGGGGGRFDGMEKKFDDNGLYDDDGKPRRTGQFSFSLLRPPFASCPILEDYSSPSLQWNSAKFSFNGKRKSFTSYAGKVEDTILRPFKHFHQYVGV